MEWAYLTIRGPVPRPDAARGCGRATPRAGARDIVQLEVGNEVSVQGTDPERDPPARVLKAPGEDGWPRTYALSDPAAIAGESQWNRIRGTAFLKLDSQPLLDHPRMSQP